MWLCGWKPIKVSYKSAKFGVRKLYGSGDMSYLIFDMTLQDHVIKGLFGLKSGSSSFRVTTLSSLLAKAIVAVEIKCF